MLGSPAANNARYSSQAVEGNAWCIIRLTGFRSRQGVYLQSGEAKWWREPMFRDSQSRFLETALSVVQKEVDMIWTHVVIVRCLWCLFSPLVRQRKKRGNNPEKELLAARLKTWDEMLEITECHYQLRRMNDSWESHRFFFHDEGCILTFRQPTRVSSSSLPLDPDSG
jgi:hypothetical protein